MTRFGRALQILAGVLLVTLIPLSIAALSAEMRWRMGVLALKTRGDLPDLAWGDLTGMLKPASGIWLKPLLDSPNPYAIIRNPRTSRRDIKTGRILFGYRCESCHGPAARGGSAPALVGRDLAHGSSDWALYLTMRDGIGGTAMQGHDLPVDDLWKLVAYVQDQVTTHDGEAAMRPDETPLPALSVQLEDLRQARSAGADWPTYYGSYNGYRFSSLQNISRHNVSQLQARWIHQLPNQSGRIEATPLAAGGRIFLTDPQGGVIALDATTGVQLWRFSPTLARNISLCCITANRGVALLGDAVFVATLDAHVIALDAASGSVRWNVMIADHKQGYSSTGAPLIVKGMVVTGIAGSEFGAPGFVTALDAATGKTVWRFDTIPKPGEKGNETWAGESWRTGGAATWMTGTYDPQLDLIYWGTANPAPDYDASPRAGDNLYSNSVLALKADTGKLAWHFQYTPGDDHDWDSVEVPVLADVVEGSRTRKVLLSANRNGFFYVLDRTDGTFLHAVPFVKQTWATRIDANGRPVRRAGASGSERGALVYPGTSGGTNWWPPTYSPVAQKFIVPALERPGVFFKTTQEERREGQQMLAGSSAATAASHYTAVRALDPLTGAQLWEHQFDPRRDSGILNGLLSTAGGLVFTNDQKKLVALDIDNGKELWSFQAGAEIHTPATTYLAGSEQFVVIVAGDIAIGMALPPPLPAPAGS